MTTPWQHLLQFFFPVTCAGCGADLPADDSYRVCPACLANVEFIRGHYCRRCGLPLPDGGEHCHTCRTSPVVRAAIVRSACTYSGITRDLIHRFKYQGRDYLDRFLGRLLAAAFERYEEIRESDLIVPVPMHRLKRLLRGYNQSELLAERLAVHLGLPAAPALLARTRITRSQAKLTRLRRLINLHNCFTVTDPSAARDRTILLVDDVCTTASTIEHCARALRHAGARRVYALTVARD